jgi:mannose-6-phosphate isomerase-like protein (cupin superfamily)
MNRRTLMLTALQAYLLATLDLAVKGAAWAGTSAVDLSALAQRLLSGLNGTLLRKFLESWPDTAIRRPSIASTVPVLKYLSAVNDHAPTFALPFVTALIAAAPELAWRRSYSPQEVGTKFFDNYGWTELVGLTGPVPSEHLACGVLLLGPHVTYPRHHHEAEEIYVPLSGTARWLRGTQNWMLRPPGSIIHHQAYQQHAMRTGNEPLLALYLWRSSRLDQKSQLDDRRFPLPSY